jgi:acyl-CoA thioesterase FadM/ketosteroid isomerase-like protein
MSGASPSFLRGEPAFSTQLPVRPRHCDAQGMLHAARFYELFEEAFLRWLDDIGVPYRGLREDGVDLVVAESGCAHEHPAVRPTSRSGRSMTIELRVRCGPRPIALGRTVYVAVSGGAAAELPPALARHLPPPAGRRPDPARVVSRLHEAQVELYGGGSRAPLEAVLAPDVVWHVPGASPISGTYHGVAEVVRYMEARRELASGTFTMHPRELLVGDHHVASLTDGTLEHDGRSYSWSTVGLYRVEDDRVAECHLIPFDQADFDRAWSWSDAPGPGGAGQSRKMDR